VRSGEGPRSAGYNASRGQFKANTSKDFKSVKYFGF
jgi:hypothetical protein